MGLCKCPKKKVTNLFCFEHRVNVCEHCLVANHSKCVVQSYLQWLQDSDYNPTCSLCTRPLSDEASGDCVRLICYDIFHWNCLNYYAQQLPSNTAPAGYTCPKCSSGVFPPSNLASPVADVLRKSLATVNWARVGLGLPLIEDNDPPRATHSPSQSSISPITLPESGTSHQYTRPSAQVSPYTSTPAPPPTDLKPHSVINVEQGMAARTGTEKTHDVRRLFHNTEEDVATKSHDADDDKYKRRPALNFLARWFSSNEGSSAKRREPTSMMKKFIVVLVIGLIGFITMIVILSRLGRHAADDDPLLDPMANPNIRVNVKEAVPM